ncbi:glutathione S-transferase family protein [Paraferrimonas sp. SM1919]|uniref:glutathione S-transferase family protein n=1 Tax=Paraferrimonas sp. SM1919 TaxID=2662263 RepID=UPI0013D366B2|nr:glutathione S-transferase N-terminal domain-containing protein [Paraferrimonas sp. SM1919]
MAYTLFKSDISYFSGKVEAYLNYKGINHTKVDCNALTLRTLAKHTGFAKMPAIDCGNGQWLTDSSLIIEYLEQQHPSLSIIPSSAALAFLAKLIEDYADEWLWRPAMWWRWQPKASRVCLGRRIFSQMFHPSLAVLGGWYFGHRQRYHWLWGDGMDKHNETAIKHMLYLELETLESLLTNNHYLFGDKPCLADFGYFASMFRHFANDPISGEVVRRQAPNTHLWLARMWSQPGHDQADNQYQWPAKEQMGPLLGRIFNDYLPYLHQNADAFANKHKRFNYQGHSFNLKGTVTDTYRVWALQQLQLAYQALNVVEQQQLQQYLHPFDLAPLAKPVTIATGLEQSFQLPISKDTPKPKYPWYQAIFGQARN